MEYQKKKSKKLLGSKGNTVSCGNTPSGKKPWKVICQEKDQYLEYMKNRKDKNKIRNKKTNNKQNQTKN